MKTSSNIRNNKKTKCIQKVTKQRQCCRKHSNNRRLLEFYEKKAEKKDLQVQIPQLVKTSDATVDEVSTINSVIKNSCKEKKKYQIDLPSKVKGKLGKYAHRYGTQVPIAYFCEKYQQYTFKRTTVSNWKWKFSNPQVGEPPKQFNKKCRHSLVGEEFVVKIKEAIIGIRPTGAVISRKMVIIILIGNGMLKANNSNNLSEFGIGITLTGNWARGVWDLSTGLSKKETLEKLNLCPILSWRKILMMMIIRWTTPIIITIFFHIWTDIYDIRIEKPLVIHLVFGFFKYPCVCMFILKSHWFRDNSLVLHWVFCTNFQEYS